MALIKRALISVTDKTGVVEFAAGLRDLGVEIISTGGTARALQEGGVAVREVSEVTGFPGDAGRPGEDHPSAHRRRHSGDARESRSTCRRLAEHRIPADRHGGGESLRVRESRGEARRASMAELIENIDIGGPTMIRAAAKNYQDVAVVTSPDDYAAILRGAARTQRRAVASRRCGGWRRRPSR